MSDDLLNVLGRFHREVMLPELKQAIQESEQRIRAESLAHFDALYKQLDRLEIEYHALAAAVGRIELRLGSTPTARSASIQDEIQQLREKVSELQRRIDELESSAS